MHLLLIALTACERPWPEGLPDAEQDARDALWATPLQVSGVVVDADGAAISGAILDFAGTQVTSGSDGMWSASIDRHNVLADAQAAGFRTERFPVHAMQGLHVDAITLDAVILTADDPEVVRFLFGGDLALGRRWLDTDESTPFDEMPPDDPDALIQVSDPLPGSDAVFDWLAPVLEVGDFRSCNLETPVLDQPDTPHPTKPYVFFTLPESLDALTGVGIEYVSLGNNHLYDYLEQGVVDTLVNVDASGLARSGGGMTPDEAWAPWDTTLAGWDYSFVSASSITGFQYDIEFQATDERGGAADLTDQDHFEEIMAQVVDAQRIPIVQLHTGAEYTDGPGEYTRGLFEHAVDQGAALVVGHHPHVVQGFSWYGGVLTAHSLGNFAFDQDRVETFLGSVFEVDMAGADVLGARVLPTYLEDYRPRVMSGDLAERFLRRVGWASADHDAVVVSHLGRGLISDQPDDFEVVTRTVQLQVEVPASGRAWIDLRQVAEAGESPTFVRAAGSTRVRPGRDLLLFGDMEDIDVDEHDLDFARWDVEGDSRFPCVMDPMRGAVALCSKRDGSNLDPSLITFRNRVRVEGDPTDTPNKDLTLIGYAQGQGAGDVTVQVEYAASEGELTFGTQDLVLDGGDYEWTPFSMSLDMPADTDDPSDPEINARAVQLRMTHTPPRKNRGLWMVDDLAIVSWGEWLEAGNGVALAAPNPYDFLLVQGSPGTLAVSVTLEQMVVAE